ncbi:MAG: heavy-metal-associated domain-containing protein [Candidatus Coproplasma sp.]
MTELKIQVEGMHCGMCESHVNDVVRRVAGVKKVSSSHARNQTVVIAEDGVDKEAIVQAIKSQGYAVGRVDSQPYVKRGLFGKRK